MTATDPASAMRAAGPDALGAALRDTRQHTLATFDAYEHALSERGMSVPYSEQLNPPLWELGHVGWFQTWWLGRHAQREQGVACDPDAPRDAPRLANADALFHSGRVAHAARWQLPMPGANALRDELARGLQESLTLLQSAGDSDDALYFFRLSLFHEDMHHEAAVYMAQHLGVPLQGWAPHPHASVHEIAVRGGTHTVGAAPARGFAFDNELGAHEVAIDDFHIDSSPVNWGRYLAFVEAGGYQERRWWSDAGWQWLQQQSLTAPRYLRPSAAGWQRHTFGQWLPLHAAAPAMNLSWHEAQAWCAWAGRRLPSEAEWAWAAQHAGADFEWGQVWEWTASVFAPYPGFVAHPYRDYSAPWFHTRQVLRGASFATHARMKHLQYRNYFSPERNDVFAGFRTCAAPARHR